MSALLERLGGILVAPRATLARLIAGDPGGFADLLLLLALEATALRLPQIGRIGWQAIDTGVLGAALLLINVLAQAIMVPLVAALVGGLLLRWSARRSPAARRATDIAALCVVPAVTLQIAVSLIAVPFPQLYQPWLRTAVRGAGGAWLVGLLLIAAHLLRGGVEHRAREATE